jgi:hypothetical protein
MSDAARWLRERLVAAEHELAEQVIEFDSQIKLSNEACRLDETAFARLHAELDVEREKIRKLREVLKAVSDLDVAIPRVTLMGMAERVLGETE